MAEADLNNETKEQKYMTQKEMAATNLKRDTFSLFWLYRNTHNQEKSKS